MASPRAIFAGFRLMGWLFPPPPLDEQLVPSPELLEQKAKRWNRVTGLLCLALLLGCGVAFCFAACVAADRHLAAVGRPLFLIRAEPFELCVWAVFLAAVIAPWLSVLLLRLVAGRPRYRECVMVMSHAKPMGGPRGVKVHFGKMFALFLFLFGPLLLDLIVLRIDTYTAFTNDAMVVNPFWSLGQEEIHPYRDVRAIYAVAGYHARFQDVDKPCYALVFADGMLWTTGDGMRAPRMEEDRQFIEHIAQRSGRPIRPIRFLEDVPR